MTALGPYDGDLSPDGEGTLEHVSPLVGAALAGEGEAEALTSDDVLASATARAGEGDQPARVRYDLDLTRLPAFDLQGDRAAGLRALAQVGQGLSTLHEQGRCHGDLRPDMVRCAGDDVRVLTPARPVDAVRLLGLRLQAGAPPAQTAYVAPEVLGGEAAAPPSDVYALAAMAYHFLAGRMPVGQLGAGPPSSGLLVPHGARLRQALDADPARRPSAALLTMSLREASAKPGERAKAPSPQGKQVSAILVLVLLLGGMFVFCGAVSLVAMSWDVLGEVGRFAVLLVLTVGIGGGGLLAERRLYERSGFGLLVLGSQLLWADAGYLLYLMDAEDEPGPWALAGLAVTAVSFLLAVRRRSAVFGVLAAGGFLVSSACFGEFISRGTDLGPPTYLLIVAGAYAGLTALGHRLAGVPVAASFALGAAGLAVLSGFWGLGVLHDHAAFGLVWPFLVCACLAAPSLRAPSPYFGVAAVGLLVLLTVAPSGIALIEDDSLPHLQLAVLVGLGLIAAAFKVELLAKDVGTQLLALLAGLVSVCVAPAVMCLDMCMDRDGFVLLEEALSKIGQLHETRFVYLAIVIGISAGLVGLGFLFAPNSQRKLGYRLLEGTGLLLFYGVLTLLCLGRTEDLFYPLLVFGGGFAVLGLGVYQRRATLAAVTVPVLILNIWIQYFGKLHDHVPMSLLLIGFGLGLLASGVFYERKVKDLLPALKDWK